MFINIFDSLVVLIVFDLVDSNAGKPATYFVGILQIKIKIKSTGCGFAVRPVACTFNYSSF